MKPSNVLAPTKLSTTKTSIHIGWIEPTSNGCSITGFDIFRDTGNSDSITVLVDAASVESKPSLRDYDILGLAPTSNTFRIKIRAYNNAGYTDSSPLSVVLSAVPDTPSTGPLSDPTVTNDSRIKVEFGP